jgi:adenosylcobinamide-GDP ribazoletransferase
MGFLAAWQFLTSLPVRRGFTPEQLGRATAWFPLVGLLLGVMLAVFYWLLDFILPPEVSTALVIIALVALTGALHLDGLADTCDGLAGYRTREERLAVMRDSRTGAFGVVGIVLILLAEYVCLNSIPSEFTIQALVFMPVVSRWAMVYAVFAFPYARPEGLGTAYKNATRWPQFTLATVITIFIAVLMYPIFSIMALLLIPSIWIITTVVAFYLKHKLGGLTGDCYGAINEVAEVAALLLTVAIYNIFVNIR